MLLSFVSIRGNIWRARIRLYFDSIVKESNLTFSIREKQTSP